MYTNTVEHNMPRFFAGHDTDKIICLPTRGEATPANWQKGDDVIILGSVSDDEAKQKYPQGWKAPKPYLRIVPEPA